MSKVPINIGDKVIVNAANTQYDRSIGEVISRYQQRSDGQISYVVKFVRHVKFSETRLSQITNIEDLHPEKFKNSGISVFDFELDQQINRELSEES